MQDMVQWVYDPALVLMGMALLGLQIGGIIAAGHAVMTNRTAQGTIAWVLFLITFPTFAFPLYLIFGGHRFRGYIRARRADNHKVRAVVENYAERIEAYRVPLAENTDGIRVIERLAHLPLTRGNRVELLIDGEATFASIYEGIASAKEYIAVQFFIIKDDEVGRELRDRLLVKLAEGVRVYFLFDEIGSRKLSRAYLRSLRNAGAEVFPFNTSAGWRNPLRLNFRNHRKVFIADGRAAWVGGHNVGKEYLGLNPRFGHWRDTHLKVQGPSVQCIQSCFLDDWYWATSTMPEFRWTPIALPEEDPAARDVIVLPGGPADDVETITLTFIHAINSAKHRVWIHSPYFVPDDQIVSALQLAAMRGVDVRILLPEKPDHLLVWLSSFYFTGQTKLRDVRIYRYLPGFLHSKMLLVDNNLAVIGTANLDNRSCRINFEIMVGVVDTGFAAEVESVMRHDFQNAREVGPEDYNNRPLWFRVASRTARLLAPIQ